MTVLYLLFTIGYILNAQASTKGPSGKEYSQEILKAYPLSDGEGARYKPLGPSEPSDNRYVQNLLKASPEYKKYADCTASRSADGVEDSDFIYLIEIQCQKGAFYVKILKRPIPKRPNKAPDQIIKVLDKLPQ
ncbi:hypothetical protein RF11_05414 [Thelohanellus kitauei]|uniref:Uncharacterized protein n=1 Tax=Thelohanellus kitauei TaxID=669202 RepID=A0A0C2ML23_THEKT|nr:hypothetical protein RF11_05414 [Thelohanellus kitauei]